MAIGERVPTTFLSKALTTTASESSYQNTSSSYRTQVTSIIITAQNSGTTLRTVTIYKGGTSDSNERFNIDIDPNGTQAPRTVTIDNPFVLVDSEAIYVKQNTGTDVNIEVSGVVEQIA